MNRFLTGSAVCLASILTLSSFGLTQEKPATESKPKPAAKGDDKLKGRLPNNYGKVDLTMAQREKIYAIQNDYDAQLDALKEQIKQLVAKRDADIDGVLTAEQKSKLAALRDEAKKKPEEKLEAKKKEAEAKKAESKKPTDEKPAEVKKPTTEAK